MEAILSMEGIDLVLADKGLKFNLDKPMLARKPKGFSESRDGGLACSHRNSSTCDECAVKYANVYEVCGSHFWFHDFDEMVWTFNKFIESATKRLEEVGA